MQSADQKHTFSSEITCCIIWTFIFVNVVHYSVDSQNTEINMTLRGIPKRFPFTRTKFRNKCAFLTISLTVSIVLLVTSKYKDSTDDKTPLLNSEDILRSRMLERRYLIKQRVCTLPGNRSAVRAELDFRNFVRPTFLPDFKNPCFVHNVTHGSERTEMFGCLPYFIVAGFPKAGSTDLWSRLVNHPDIVLNHVKEPMFFNKGKTETSFKAAVLKYITFYSRTADILQRNVCPVECRGTSPYHHSITGEASVDTAYDNRDWQMLPGNEGCTEPVVTNADYVHHLNPNIKVIFVVRNPIERLYSDYIYESRFYGYTISAEDFHKTVVSAIYNFTQCVAHNTLRACLYNGSKDSNKIRLKIGVYHVFLEDWLGVISPRNMLVIRSEDTLGDRKFDVYRRLFKFLQIRPYTWQEQVRIFARGPINTRSRPEKDVGDMWPQTRQVLYDFYHPYNEQLKLLLPGVDYNSVKSKY